MQTFNFKKNNKKSRMVFVLKITKFSLRNTKIARYTLKIVVLSRSCYRYPFQADITLRPSPLNEIVEIPMKISFLGYLTEIHKSENISRKIHFHLNFK